jgi:hypothetical protein
MKNNIFVTTLFFGALLLFGAMLYGCGEHSGSSSRSWTAEIHPDAENPSETQSLGEFPSYEACLEAAIAALGGDGVFNCSIS